MQELDISKYWRDWEKRNLPLVRVTNVWKNSEQILTIFMSEGLLCIMMDNLKTLKKHGKRQ